MLLILLSWFICTTVFLAFGEILIGVWIRITGREASLSLVDTFWLGLGSCGTFISILSLFLPLNIYVLVAFIFITALYWLINRKHFAHIINSAYKWFISLIGYCKIAIILITTVIIVFSLSIPYVRLYDEWLYHLQTIIWNEQYHVIPGLGNLHGRFAFNSNFLLLAGFFGYHPGSFPSLFTLTGLCLLIISLWMIDWLNSMKKSNLSCMILLIALFFLIYFLRYTFSSTMTDPLPAIFVIYIILSLIHYNLSVEKLFVWTVMAAFCITLKTSTVAILLVPILAFICMLRNWEIKPLVFIFTFCLIIAIVWCTRSVFLSGYLVYPFSSIDLFNFDWKIPKISTIEEKEWVYSWARIADMDRNVVLAMPLNKWIPEWLTRQEISTLILYFFAIISPIIIFFRKKFFKNKPVVLFAWIIALTGTLFGLFTAPDIRFNIGFVLCSAIIPFFSSIRLSLSTNFIFIRKPIYLYTTFIVVSGLILLSMGVRQLIHYKMDDERLLTFILYPQTSDKLKDNLGIEFNETIINGIKLFVPRKGNQCYDHCIPCIPSINNSLEMRGENFQDGFKIKRNGTNSLTY